MKYLPRLLALTGWALLLLTAVVLAGSTGKIAGHVVNSQTGEPLPVVNIVVDGGYIGGSTDLDGYYFIINVPPGVHYLDVSTLGYAPQRVEDVIVNVDQTAPVDVALTPSVIQAEAVTVVARKPIVKMDRTFATSTVGLEDLKLMPIAQLSDVVEIQAGVVDGHFRGGRKGEVVYMVDDIPIQDVYDNTQATTVNQGAVQELQVISGAFNAEYGQAMSGVVNMITREGGQKFTGSASFGLGDYLSIHEKEFYNIWDLNPFDIQNYEASLSGPLPYLKGLSFFANGRWQDNEGWQYGNRRWGLEHDVVIQSGTIMDMLPHFGDSSAAAMNYDRDVYLYGKLTWSINPTLKLNYSTLSENKTFSEYDHAWKYVPDGNFHRFRHSRTNILKATTVFSQKSFLEAGYSNTFTEYYHYVFKRPYDSRYVHPVYMDKPDVTLHFAGTKMEHFRRFTDTHTFNAKYAWQVTPVHYVVAGANYNLNAIAYDQYNIIHNGNPYLAPEDPENPSPLKMENYIEDASGLNTDRYLYHPVEAAVFVQDKVELKSFVVNAGLRFDYFYADGKVLTDPQDPNIYNPLIETRRAQTVAERESYWYKKPTPKMQVSPRLGVGYSISSDGMLHFSYGHFFQRPKYEYLFTNPDFEIDAGQTINTLMGNADLDAEQTISYEFGLQQGITEDLVVNLSVFQRTINNLVSSDKIVTTYDAGTKYTMYVNRDFAEARGFVLSLDKRYSGNISGGIDYTFQIAEGNASEPGDAFNAAKGDKEPIKELIPLDWDRRHTVNMNLNYAVANSWGVSALMTYGSGLPYTSETRGDDSPVLVLFENDARKPAYFNVDMSGFWMLPLWKKSGYSFKLDVMVKNVFDRLNENDVFKDTGRATYTRDEDLKAHQEIAYINTLEEVYTHPEFYSRPREVRVSVTVGF